MRRRDLICGAIIAGAASFAGAADAAQSLRCVMVGDAMVGKTWALSRYAQNTVPSVYAPTVSGDYSVDLTRDGQLLQARFFDAPSSDESVRQRALVYPQTDVFIIAYAVDSPNSFDNVSTKWAPELRHYALSARVVLAALKSDLRSGQASNLVPRQAAESVAAQLRFQAYRECSALTQAGLGDLFSAALDVASDREPGSPSRFQRVQIGRQPMRRPGN